jgi:hypothetical protein
MVQKVRHSVGLTIRVPQSSPVEANQKPRFRSIFLAALKSNSAAKHNPSPMKIQSTSIHLFPKRMTSRNAVILSSVQTILISSRILRMT